MAAPRVVRAGKLVVPVPLFMCAAQTLKNCRCVGVCVYVRVCFLVCVCVCIVVLLCGCTKPVVGVGMCNPST